MSNVIYEGKNNKLVFFLMHYVDKEPDYNSDKSQALMLWYIKENTRVYDCTSGKFINDLLHTMKSHSIVDRKMNAYNNETDMNEEMFLHTVVITLINDNGKVSDEHGFNVGISNTLYKSYIPENYNATNNNKNFSFNDVYGVWYNGYSYLSNEYTSIPNIHLFRSHSLYSFDFVDMMVQDAMGTNSQNRKVLCIRGDKPNLKKVMIRKSSGDCNNNANYYNCSVTIENDYTTATKDNDKYWVRIYDTNGVNQTLVRTRSSLKSKISAYYLNSVLILSDSTSLFDELKEQLVEILHLSPETNLIMLNKYNILHTIPYGYGMPYDTFLYFENALLDTYNPHKALVITMAKKDNIISIENQNRTENVQYIKLDIKYLIKHNKVIKHTSSYRNNHPSCVILPYEDGKNTHLRALDYIIDFAELTNSEDKIKALNNYIDCLVKDNTNSDQSNDILNIWFQKVTTNAVSDKDKIKKAYKTLEKDLLNEQTRIDTYFNNINLSNKKPIPSLQIKKTIKRNVISKYGIGIDSVAYTNISNIKLSKPVEKYTIDFNYILKKKNHSERTRYGTVNLKDVYDDKNNNIIIDLDK